MGLHLLTAAAVGASNPSDTGKAESEPGRLKSNGTASGFDRITVEPGKCGGKPCIRGMRITVRRVLEILATYRDREEIFREYPFLEDEDLQQALRYAAASVDDEVDHLDHVA
jgi:uncharacterized protein (DUF433 family)